jgi:hypothetical protein
LYPQPPLLIRRSLRPDKLPGTTFSVMSIVLSNNSKVVYWLLGYQADTQQIL